MGRLTRIGAGLAALALMLACSPSEVPGEQGGSGGQNAVRFLIAENFWADWTPYQSTAQSQHRLNNHMYDTLLQFPSGDIDEPQPMLATEWDQIDATTWEFRLRDDVTFHNGDKFTADDVKASIEWASGASGEETILVDRWVPTTVEVIDDYTVRLVTEEPLASAFDAIRQTPIVSAADVQKGPEAMADKPNGTGPFVLAAQSETRKAMSANQDYWRDPPAIDRLVWEFVGDAQTRVNALLSGQADAIDRVPADQHAAIESAGGYSVRSMTASEQVNLWSVPGRVPMWDNSPELRRAVMLAIDRQAIAENLVQGESVVAQSFMPSETLYYSESSPGYEQDLQEARRLVRQAGAQGLKFQVWVATGFLPAADRVAQAIVANLRQIGLEPTLVTADVAGLVEDTDAGDAGKGLLYHLSWSSGGAPAAAMGIYGTPNKWADGDATIDRLIAQGRAATNSTQREQVYAELQDYLWQKLPHIPLYYSDFTIAHTEELKGLRVLPNYETNFYPAKVAE